MRPFARRPPAPQQVSVSLDSLRLTVDHRVTHEAPPKPAYVTLMIEDQESGRVGQFISHGPGEVISLPPYLTGYQDQPARSPVLVRLQW